MWSCSNGDGLDFNEGGEKGGGVVGVVVAVEGSGGGG